MSDSDSVRKRVRGTPTGDTPKQQAKRSYLQSRVNVKGKNKLSFSGEDAVCTKMPRKGGNWTAHEEKALVEFVMLNSKEDKWPITISGAFWELGANFVSQRCVVLQRTGEYRVVMKYILRWIVSFHL